MLSSFRLLFPNDFSHISGGPHKDEAAHFPDLDESIHSGSSTWNLGVAKIWRNPVYYNILYLSEDCYDGLCNLSFDLIEPL